MKKWMLAAYVALSGLAQANEQIGGDECEEHVTSPTTPMAGPADTWPPHDVLYEEPIGLHWPDNPEEGNDTSPAGRMIFRSQADSTLYHSPTLKITQQWCSISLTTLT